MFFKNYIKKVYKLKPNHIFHMEQAIKLLKYIIILNKLF